MTPAAPSAPKRLFALLATAVALVLLVVCAFLAYFLHLNQLRYQAQADATARNLSQVLEYALHAHFQEVDLTLQRAAREFRDLHAGKRFTDAAFSSYLSSLKERVPQARSIRGSNAQGMVVYGEDVDPARPVDLKIREFYQRALAGRELVFGVPVRSRISGEVVFPLGMALADAQGAFGGVAYVNMNNARITELVRTLDLGPHGVITLIDRERRVLHRYPEVAGIVNGKPVMLARETNAVLDSGAAHASYPARSTVDGELRRYSVRRIGLYPVYIVVGLSERDVLAPWQGEVRNAIVFVLLLLAMAGALLAGVGLSLRRQRLALDALTASETRFRSLTDSLPQMIWIANTRGEIEYVSERLVEFSGLPAATLAARGALYTQMHPDDLPVLRQAWAGAVANAGRMHCETRLRRHDGAWRLCENFCLPQRAPDGAILCWVGSSADITEAREAHDALLLAKDQALAAGRAKSEFLANMSHEIRSPMNAVLGMLQLLQRTALGALQRDYAAKAETSARALLGILNDILDFSKVEEGKLALDPQPFSVDKLLRELAVILSANANDKDIEVLFDISPALPRMLVGDALRLQQVLLNLAGNAIKFTERGEVLLSVGCAPGAADAIEVSFSVRDTGIGIAPAHLEHIFDSFAQAEASTARRFGGTGLGLTISQRLVRLMGGTLRVRSVQGQGSTFEFSIAMQRAAVMQPARADGALRGLSCLIVDDNTTGREVLAAIARSFGWVADLVDSGYAAIGALGARRYDIVLLDWRMPGMDGWETARCMRQQAPGGPLPLLIMVTAHDRALVAHTQAELAPTLDALLVKPVTPSVLFDTVANLRLGRLDGPLVPGPAPAARLAGLHLLVVDDNAMNQQVASELLRAEGAVVAVADGGHAAIAMVGAADTRCDLVLMDIQMPDMDGYAATAAILGRLGEAAPPIVAMTANAMQADRDAAHAAGMVDHVGKPFELEQLIGVILRHARRGAAAPSVLNQAAALARLGGNAKVYQHALKGFPAEMDKLCAGLEAARAAGQVEAAYPLLHTLKGLAGLVGADQLGALAHEVSEALRLGGAAPRWDGVAAVLAGAREASRQAASAV